MTSIIICNRSCIFMQPKWELLLTTINPTINFTKMMKRPMHIYCFFLIGCPQLYLPLITRNLTPKSRLPFIPSTNTASVGWSVCPSPGINAIASFLFDSLTRQHFLSPELGLRGRKVMVSRTIPLTCGRLPSNG